MSYDWEGEVPPPSPKKHTLRERVSIWWWAFLLWCALDASSPVLNRWGLRRIEKGGRK